MHAAGAHLSAFDTTDVAAAVSAPLQGVGVATGGVTSLRLARFEAFLDSLSLATGAVGAAAAASACKLSAAAASDGTQRVCLLLFPGV